MRPYLYFSFETNTSYELQYVVNITMDYHLTNVLAIPKMIKEEYFVSYSLEINSMKHTVSA